MPRKGFKYNLLPKKRAKGGKDSTSDLQLLLTGMRIWIRGFWKKYDINLNKFNYPK